MTTLVDNILSPLKAAIGAVEKLIDIRDTVKFGEATVKLQSQIMAAYHATFEMKDRESAMHEEASQLKKRVAELEAWDAEKQRYELTQVSHGVFAYTPKPSEPSTEPFHMLCANCYHAGQKSFLQARQELRMRRRVHSCHRCKAEIELEYVPLPAPVQVRPAPSSMRRV
jgi:hypothetical protein